MSERIHVECCSTYANEYGPGGDNAWRICYEHLGDDWGLSIEFARKQDAECALKAIVAAGYDTPKKPHEAEVEQRNRIMCESLAW